MSISAIEQDHIYDHPSCIFVEGGAALSSGWFKRNIMMTLDEIDNHRKNYDNRDVFITAYQYDSGDKEKYRSSNKYGALYLDFDSKEIDFENNSPEDNEEFFEQVRLDALRAVNFFVSVYGLRVEDLDIYFSGSKGIHITVHPILLGIEPQVNLNRIFKEIVTKIQLEHNTLDTGNYDVVRLWRLPNSINTKTGYYKIPITYHELQVLSLANICNLATQPRYLPPKDYRTNHRARRVFKKHAEDFTNKLQGGGKKQYRGRQKAMDITPPCVVALLMSAVPKGQRNNTAIALASVFYQQGFSKEEALGSLIDWSSNNCSPPLNESELKAVVESQYSHEYTFGCEKMKEISVCDKDNCKLVSRRRRIR